MQHPDEGTIHAWLDRQLPPDEAAQVEAHVAGCRTCADAVAEARGLIAASSRILTALDTVPRGVVPGEPDSSAAPSPVPWAPGVASAARTRRRWLSGPSLALAATILVAVGTFTVLDRSALRKAPVADVAVARREAAPANAPTPELAASRAPLGGVTGAGQPSADSSPAVAMNEQRAVAAPNAVAEDERAKAADALRPTVPPVPAPAAVASRVDSTGRAEFADRAVALRKTAAADTAVVTVIRERDTARNPFATQRAAESAAGAAAATGAITGRVTDANATPLAGAMVTVANTAIGAATDTGGRYTVAGVPAGTQRVDIRRSGYEPAARAIIVTAGDTAAANIVMRAAALQLSDARVAGVRSAAPTTAAAPPPTATAESMSTAAATGVGCYELGITPTSPRSRADFRAVPRRLALEPDVVTDTADAIWYRARDVAGTAAAPEGRWRPIDTNALEIEWTYGTRSTTMRLMGASAGPMLRGTLQEIDRATGMGDAGNVVARRTACDR